jgi:monoamine oxidase
MIDFNNNTNTYVHDSHGNKYVAKTVVAALPKDDLLKMKIFNAKQRKMLNAVESISLHRIYAAWDSKHVWFNNISKTTTDNHIRQFIPIDRRNGLAMVSYSDTKDADYWEKKTHQGVNSLWNPLKKLLRTVYGNHIEPPKWIKSYYWSAGVHVWKPKVDSAALIPLIRQIMGKSIPFYIVGEAYCKHQGWIEGALISVEELIQDMHKHSHL